MVRRRRTDGRIAFENIVEPIQPNAFEIQVLDNNLEPIGGFLLSATIDDKEIKNKQTNENGVVKVSRPARAVKVSAAAEESDISDESDALEESNVSEESDDIVSGEEYI
jgi:hypothetical protein